jgi:hypothetical protein
MGMLAKHRAAVVIKRRRHRLQPREPRAQHELADHARSDHAVFVGILVSRVAPAMLSS